MLRAARTLRDHRAARCSILTLVPFSPGAHLLPRPLLALPLILLAASAPVQVAATAIPAIPKAIRIHLRRLVIRGRPPGIMPDQGAGGARSYGPGYLASTTWVAWLVDACSVHL